MQIVGEANDVSTARRERCHTVSGVPNNTFRVFPVVVFEVGGGSIICFDDLASAFKARYLTKIAPYKEVR